MSPAAWRAVLLAVALELLVVAVAVAACSSGSAPLPPGPAPTSASSPASTAPRERDAIRLALDAAWDSDPHLYACGLPSTDVTDRLAAVVQTVVEAPRLDAVLMAQQYRRERCPGR